MCFLFMKFTILAFVLVFQYEVSCEVICETEGCMTYEQMGSWYSFYFENERYNKYAPCLQFGKTQDQFGKLKCVYCFKNTFGYWKRCNCYENGTFYDNKWCNPTLYGPDHTMCLYETKLKSDKCGEVKEHGVISQEDKDVILEKHNELRAKVANGQETKGVDGGQPKAANMRKLVWNDDLAEIAQRWADQCKPYRHDKNRRTEEQSWIGQNHAWLAHAGESFESMKQKYPNQNFFKGIAQAMIQMWYDEVDDMTQKAFSEYKDREYRGARTGHYTQFVWADTYQIGCGYITYANKPSSKWNVETVLVCNYGPGGNILGEPLYKVGEPGSECPSGTTKTTEGLCA